MKMLTDNRRFGLSISSGLLVATGLNWWRHGSINFLLVAIFLCLLVITLLVPFVLTRPKAFMEWLGRGIGEIITAFLLILFYFFIVTPLGLINKMLKNDPLALKYDEKAESYWIADKQEQTDLTKQY